jgi:hypothetical protein
MQVIASRMNLITSGEYGYPPSPKKLLFAISVIPVNTGIRHLCHTRDRTISERKRVCIVREGGYLKRILQTDNTFIKKIDILSSVFYFMILLCSCDGFSPSLTIHTHLPFGRRNDVKGRVFVH